MDKTDAMRLFVRVVERHSFSGAARDLGLPRSSVSQAIRELESRLGGVLLRRTTRQVQATPEGHAFYERCVSILAEIDDAETAFATGKIAGRVRVSVHGSLARHFLLPQLQPFIAANPNIDLIFQDTERPPDVVKEGVDCVLTVGDFADSSLTVRKVAVLKKGTFASPAYLKHFGTPQDLGELAKHRMVGFLSPSTGAAIPFEFVCDGQARSVALPTIIGVTGAESNVRAGELGLGLIQIPRYRARDLISSGKLVEVLGRHPPPALPVSVLYFGGRPPAPRVRIVIDWIVSCFSRPDE